MHIRTLPKINFLITWLAICALSCKKDNGDNLNISAVNSTLTSGNWRITAFIEDNVDETNHFSGYVFTFDLSGTVTAVQAGNSVSGHWFAGKDDSKVKLNLDFGSDDPWEELGEDWRVLERTDSKIRLQHTSGGDGSIDSLTFERN